MRYLPFLASIPMYYWMAITERHHFWMLVIQLLILLGFFLWGLRLNRFKLKLPVLLGFALMFRLMMFVDIPQLSDDFYRFVWDGELAERGINPYDHKPAELKNHDIWVTSFFDELNSPEYYTVYTPMHQSVFAVSAMASDTLLGVTNAMRSIYLLVDLLLIIVLYKLFNKENTTYSISVIYGLFPLVVLEFVGNLHFELFMLFFIVLFIYLARHRLIALSGIAYGMAIGTKLLPLMFLPFFVRWWKIRRNVVFGVFMLLTVGLMALPLINFGRWVNMSDSLGLYFDTFEFNASIYYLIRSIAMQVVDYNPIHYLGPALSMAVLLVVLMLAAFNRVRDVRDFCGKAAIALTVYLMAASIVHPWYILPVFLLGMISGYLYPVLWVCLGFLSYHSYQFTDYHEWDWILFAEYVPVYVVFVIEMLRGPQLDRLLSGGRQYK